MASQSCEVKRIQVNSAQQALDIAQQGRDQARTDYLACLGPQEQGNAAIQDAQPEIDRLAAESKELFSMNEVVLQLLGRESQVQNTIVDLARYTQQEGQSLQNEIDELKVAIRTERRKFLDGAPSVSPAVGGLYYTQTPDNKLLIAFLSCLGAFLLFVSVAILMNMVPLDYVLKLTSGERIKIIGLLWVVALGASWGGLYLFT
jgi:hypothetical protein